MSNTQQPKPLTESFETSDLPQSSSRFPPVACTFTLTSPSLLLLSFTASAANPAPAIPSFSHGPVCRFASSPASTNPTQPSPHPEPQSPSQPPPPRTSCGILLLDLDLCFNLGLDLIPTTPALIARALGQGEESTAARRLSPSTGVPGFPAQGTDRLALFTTTSRLLEDSRPARTHTDRIYRSHITIATTVPTNLSLIQNYMVGIFA